MPERGNAITSFNPDPCEVWNLRVRGLDVPSISRKLNCSQEVVYDILADEIRSRNARFGDPAYKRELQRARFEQQIYALGEIAYKASEHSDLKNAISSIREMTGVNKALTELDGLNAPQRLEVNATGTVETEHFKDLLSALTSEDGKRET